MCQKKTIMEAGTVECSLCHGGVILYAMGYHKWFIDALQSFDFLAI